MEHELKTWMPYYEAVLSGDKPFEVRRNDRCFHRYDVLWLREWDQCNAERDSLTSDNAHYTGRHHKRPITYVLTGVEFGVREGYVVLGLGDATEVRP
jgi:Domain of unknown function (DUF3850)